MFNIPNLFTATNLLCGITAILFSLAGRIDIAPYFIFAAAILDFFDGFLARLLNQQGELGKQLDSLADVVSFGVAPGVICFVVLAVSTSSDFQQYNGYYSDFESIWQSWFQHFSEFQVDSWLPFVALLIPFFSMFRLAKFNIDTRQSDSFIGLPTPANTIFFLTFPLLLAVDYPSVSTELNWVFFCIQPAFFIPLIVIMSLMLVAEIPLFAMKFKSFAWKGNEIRYIFLISCGILIPTLYTWSIPIVVFLYLILSFIHQLLRKTRTHEI
jgi:CDP-diacylglycerol--serine O-phosphatidyltransferase